MSLLRSICCMFGSRCAEEEPKPTRETMRREAPGDLGQREAERERASEDQLRRMEGGATSTPRQGPLVDFFFEGAERGPPGRTRGISIKRVALYARPSGLI